MIHNHLKLQSWLRTEQKSTQQINRRPAGKDQQETSSSLQEDNRRLIADNRKTGDPPLGRQDDRDKSDPMPSTKPTNTATPQHLRLCEDSYVDSPTDACRNFRPLRWEREDLTAGASSCPQVPSQLRTFLVSLIDQEVVIAG